MQLTSWLWSHLNITLGTVVELNLRGTKFSCTTVRCWIQSREVSCEYHIYNNKPEFIVRTPLWRQCEIGSLFSLLHGYRWKEIRVIDEIFKTMSRYWAYFPLRKRSRPSLKNGQIVVASILLQTIGVLTESECTYMPPSLDSTLYVVRVAPSLKVIVLVMGY